MSEPTILDWHHATHASLAALDITFVAHVPDAGHAALIRLCETDAAMRVVTLTTEQDGIGVLGGAWSGGGRGALLMQSSGVGNCINALALATTCRIPLLLVVSMRGEWGEFIPWQVPMGQATPAVLRAMDVRVFRVDDTREVAPTVRAAGDFAFNTRQVCAVLLSQKMLGAKRFSEGDAGGP